MDYENILITGDGPVLTVTFNRPEILNPLDKATLEELKHCLAAAQADTAVEIILLRGSGRAFSAGGDLKKYLSLHRDVAFMRELTELASSVMRTIEEMEEIVVAVVEGLCVAGGIELMLCCDYVIATSNASFSDGHMSVAMLPGAGGTQRMPRLIGPLKAKDLLLTARFVSAGEAEAMGLVTCCVAPDALETKLAELIATLRTMSFPARAAVKYLVNQGLKGTLDAGLVIEKHYVEHFNTTHPHPHEGLLAFAEKRKPHFGSPRGKNRR